MDGNVDKILDDVYEIVLEKAEPGVNASHTVHAVSRSGLVTELVRIETRADQAAASGLMFRREEFPSLREVDASGQLLLAVSRRVHERIKHRQDGLAPAPDNAEDKQKIVAAPEEPGDPITAAAERAIAAFERRGHRRRDGDASDLEGIQREIDWIGESLRRRRVGRAEIALIQLMDRQADRSLPEHLVKTMTAVADLARKASHLDWAMRVFDAMDLIGLADASAPTARAETLRALGRYDDALAGFEEAMRLFPHDEAAPTARAETLRALGRYDDALAGFEEAMRLFPHDEAAPTARAEALRALGRYDDALAGFEEVMRLFPHNEVAKRACAHLLGQIGQSDRAEALLAPAIDRLQSHGDWVAMHIRAMIRLRAGQVQSALTDFEQGAKDCAFRDQRAYFQAGVSLALLADNRAAEGARRLEALAKDHVMPPKTAAMVALLHVHALAEAGEMEQARERVTSAEIIDFSEARQRLLAMSLSERYALATHAAASAERARELDLEISAAEFDLVRPDEMDSLGQYRRAA